MLKTSYLTIAYGNGFGNVVLGNGHGIGTAAIAKSVIVHIATYQSR